MKNLGDVGCAASMTSKLCSRALCARERGASVEHRGVGRTAPANPSFERTPLRGFARVSLRALRALRPYAGAAQLAPRWAAPPHPPMESGSKWATPETTCTVRRSTLKTIAPQSRLPVKFFLLVFVLSSPFALIGAVTGAQLFAGLPIVALAFVCPMAAASILVYRENGTAGVAALLQRGFDYQRIKAKVWYVPIVLLMPGVMALTYGVMHLMKMPLPTPQFSILPAAAMLLAFFILALGEELGWSGYAIDPMQNRWNALQASLLLGLVWAVWHIVAMVQVGQSPVLIAWGCLSMIASRVLYTWIYNNTGKSVFATALFHAIANLSIKSLFPDFPGGSYNVQPVSSMIIVFVAAAVTVVWGPRTLARYRNT